MDRLRPMRTANLGCPVWDSGQGKGRRRLVARVASDIIKLDAARGKFLDQPLWT